MLSKERRLGKIPLMGKIDYVDFAVQAMASLAPDLYVCHPKRATPNLPAKQNETKRIFYAVLKPLLNMLLARLAGVRAFTNSNVLTSTPSSCLAQFLNSTATREFTP